MTLLQARHLLVDSCTIGKEAFCSGIRFWIDRTTFFRLRCFNYPVDEMEIYRVHAIRLGPAGIPVNRPEVMDSCGDR